VRNYLRSPGFGSLLPEIAAEIYRRKGKTMKKLALDKIAVPICLLVFLAFASTTSAEAQLIGTLDQGDSWSLEFLGLGAADNASVMVTFIDSRGKQHVDLFTIPVGSPVSTLVYDKASIGNNIRRIILGAEMFIWQGSERPRLPTWTFPVVNDATPMRYVFNVAAAP
jgi:hypothetical protein